MTRQDVDALRTVVSRRGFDALTYGVYHPRTVGYVTVAGLALAAWGRHSLRELGRVS